MSIAKLLQAGNKVVIVAPAGYGKTHIIAEAVVNFGKGRELILTHTHAGVDSIRRKILSLNPSKRNFHVGTIDGFILRYVLNYPVVSKWNGNIDDIDWSFIRACGVNLFKKDFIKAILRNSYDGLYVDEYQDCCLEQHAIILELSSILPTRVLGDPLQGIFNFGSNKIVDWQTDVNNNFNNIGTLDKPWRWDNVNNGNLGNWLGEVRRKILNKEQISLTNLPDCVKWVKNNNHTDVIKECFLILSKINNNESVVIIGIVNQEAKTHNIASKLRGCYGVVEPIESRDLKKYIDKFGDICPYKKGLSALDFGCCCFTGISKTRLKQEYTALENKKYPNRRKQLAVSQPLEQLLSANNLESLFSLIGSFQNIDKSYLFRKELYFEVLKILRESLRTGIPLKEVMLKVRENTRRLGRKMPKRIIARTVLIKGLEFDHAIVVDADKFDKNNLYVALTRASKTVTIVSNANTLC